MVVLALGGLRLNAPGSSVAVTRYLATASRGTLTASARLGAREGVLLVSPVLGGAEAGIGLSLVQAALSSTFVKILANCDLSWLPEIPHSERSTARSVNLSSMLSNSIHVLVSYNTKRVGTSKFWENNGRI